MNKTKKDNYKSFSNLLLNWYDKNRRNLPWRALSGELPNPYFVYLSEIMLQQTVVSTVIPYFLNFVKKWTTIDQLAKADFQEVSSCWAGLGYYSRAKNLHETAKIISNDYNSIIPCDKSKLLSLPGIGNYTASAIMAIAFDIKSNVIDGNVERIFSRLYAVDEPLEKSKKYIEEISERYLPNQRYGDYAQALMDLGSLICIPKSPRCPSCPLISFCKVGGTANAKIYPKRLPKKNKNNRYGLFFCLINQHGDILMTKNNNKGLLSNMDVIPSIGWLKEDKNYFSKSPNFITQKDSLFDLDWKILEKKIIHVFTHFKLNCSIAIAYIDNNEILKDQSIKKSYRFIDSQNLKKLAIPSLIKKIIKYLEDENLF